MRETDFIRKNEEKWAEYEQLLAKDQQDPDKLSELYVHTTDDLSYSRTFYPNRSVRVYLNGLARRTFLRIYRGRRGESGRFVTFWTDELPRILFEYRRALLLSLVLFVLSMVIGVISYRINPQFAEFILGDYYVEMTRSNIRNGDPMAVYKARGQLDMFLHITLNNIYVAFQVFIMGAFYAIGSVYLLMSNGVMVGVFQYFFVDQGLLRESFLTIWIHGALEISSIVIAGAAGLTMGSGLLFPGTYSRARAFGRSARAGFKIMLGTVPLFVIAGFLEAFLTRQTQLHDALRLAFILLCFAFILWYYWYYPREVAARPPRHEDEANTQNERVSTAAPIVTDRIKPIGEVLTETALIVGRHAGYLARGLLLSAALFCGLLFSLSPVRTENMYVFADDWLAFFYNTRLLFSPGAGLSISGAVAALVGIYALLLVAAGVARRGIPTTTESSPWTPARMAALVLPAAGITICLSLPELGWVLLVLFLFFPCLLVYAFLSARGLGGFGRAFSYTYRFIANNYGIFFLQLLLGFFVFFILDTAVTRLVFGLLSWLLSANSALLYEINVVVQAFLYFAYFGLLLTVWFLGLGLNFYANRERYEAHGLLAEVQKVGEDRRLRGLETEK